MNDYTFKAHDIVFVLRDPCYKQVYQRFEATDVTITQQPFNPPRHMRHQFTNPL